MESDAKKLADVLKAIVLQNNIQARLDVGSDSGKASEMYMNKSVSADVPLYQTENDNLTVSPRVDFPSYGGKSYKPNFGVRLGYKATF
jgi:hypothetical protein